MSVLPLKCWISLLAAVEVLRGAETGEKKGKVASAQVSNSTSREPKDASDVTKAYEGAIRPDRLSAATILWPTMMDAGGNVQLAALFCHLCTSFQPVPT